MKIHAPLALLALAAPALPAAGTNDAPAWEKLPPLTADPALLLESTKAVPVQSDAGVQDLLEEALISYDAQGRQELRYRYVFRVDRDASVADWRQVSMSWSPWHEARPELRARVITPDGHSYELDPKTIGEYSSDNGDKDVYGDGKTLKAPLPQLCRGAIAEVFVIRKETTPFASSGAAGWWGLSQSFPVQRTRIEISAPTSSALKAKVYSLPGTAFTRTVENGRVRLSLELGPMPAQKKGEANLPDADAYLPSIAYSTTPSWRDAAAEYAAIVDRQLTGADLKAWVDTATQGEATRDGKIARILAKLHAQARYTGIEFGVKAIVPTAPAETLRRGYGDCKDKASLLVAALRAAGIPAEVALVDVGPGSDVDPDMPGLRQFDHAIVHVPGDKPLWIDATAEFARLGTQYPGVAGRYALIASPSTTGLTRIPAMNAEDNLESETREVWFGDEAPGSVVETTECKGNFEQGIRGSYASDGPKKVHEQLEGYAKDTFKAGSVPKIEYTDPTDLTKPFKLVIQAKDAAAVKSDSASAGLPLSVWSMVTSLVDQLGGLPDPKDTSRVKRVGALQLPAPYTRELRYVIHCPAGYRPDVLPPTTDRAFGPAILKQSFLTQADGSILATYRFSTGKQIWSPAEVETGLQALKAFGDEDTPKISFVQSGEADLEAGNVKAAIKEFQDLAKTQPGKATPLLHYANALLAVGLGEEAREKAREAVKLEPDSARTHIALAWISQHDLVGRRFGKGWDRATAITEYRKAKALDPKSYGARGDLAILLEHDAEGTRYAPDADLSAAVEEYRAIAKDLDNHGLDLNLLILLAKTGRYGEAVSLARTMKPEPTRNSFLVACLIASQGYDRGIQASEAEFPDLTTRRAAYLAAADQVLRMRFYPEAARLLREGSEGTSSMDQARSRAELLARTRRFDAPPSEEGPKGLIQRFIRATFSDRPPKEISPFLSPAVTGEEGFADDLVKSLHEVTRTLSSGDLPRAVLLDLTFSLSQIAVDGDDAKGYQVRVRGLDGSSQVYFIARMDGAYRLIGVNASRAELGLQALWDLDHARGDEARNWLDLARTGVSSPPSDDPVAGMPFARLWTKGKAGTDAEARLAALVLACSDSNSKKRLSELSEARAKADADKAVALDTAIVALAMKLDDTSKLDAASLRLMKEAPESQTAVGIRVGALASQSRWSEVVVFSKAEQPKHPDFTLLETVQYGAMAQTGDRMGSERGLQSLIDRGKADAADYNNLAWSQVARGAVTDQTLELIRQATQNGGSSYALHTLAVVLTELGRTTEAQKALLKEMDARSIEEPGSNEWYVLGRIAEQLGIPDAALKAYARVKADKPQDAQDASSCWSLAAKRIAVLKGAKA